MENNDIFIRTLLMDKVKLKPNLVSAKLKDNLLYSLQQKFEGVCSHHGFIKPNSIEIFKFSLGYIQALSLNGDVEYMVNYYADVCNPSVGSIVHTQVVNTNKFGILAHTGYKDASNKFINILEIVIAKNMINTQHDKNAEELQVGDQIHVEILGKKFELSDKKINAIARIVNNDNDQNILDDNETNIENDDNIETEDDGESSEEDSDDQSETSEKSASEDNDDNDEDDNDDDSQLGDDIDEDGDGDDEGFFSGGDDISDFE